VGVMIKVESNAHALMLSIGVEVQLVVLRSAAA
jgi:hypothetical protein